MDIEYLQEFVSLAETCNYQETAELLHISQPSLTKHIQRLESEIGTQLFDRTTRSVKLNAYGESFYHTSKEIVQQYQRSLEKLKTIKASREGRINIGFSPALGPYGIIELIADFNALYPDYLGRSIEMSGRAPNAEELISGRCDFIFAAANAISDEKVQSVPFKLDHLTIMFPEDHPLAGEDRVTAGQLRGEKFIVHRPSYGITELESEALLQCCDEAGFEPNVVATGSFATNISRMVGKGEGCAAMFRMHAPYVPGIRVVDLSPEVSFMLCCFFLRDKKLSDTQKAFLALVQDHADL